jgi:hypothetical protein
MAQSFTAPTSVAPAGDPPPYVTANGRDLRLDLLRGLCVLVVVIDHISGASPLYLFTGGGVFFTSAAEGFILISGLTAGLVYRRLMARDGLVPSMTKALSRAFSLYLLTVSLLLFLVPISEALQLPWSHGLDLSRSLKFVISVLTLHHAYPFVDVLLLYALLFLALPLALLLIEQRRAWIVLLASWLIWAVYQVYPEPATFPWQIESGHAFPFSSWQALFFTAFLLSYYRDRLPRLSPTAQGRLRLVTGLAFAGFLLLFAALRLPADGAPAMLAPLRELPFDTLFDRSSMGVGRIVASAAVFGFLLLTLTRWWTPLYRALRGLLLPFGQHALYAWTAHIVAIVVIGIALLMLGLGEDNYWLNGALQIGAVAAVWLATRRQFLAVTPRNRRYWRTLAPAALALFALLVLQLPVFDAL